MTDVELLPLPEPVAQCTNETALALADAPRSLRNYVATLQGEIEALRAEVAQAREFRDKMANAIGNDQLRRFIEKHGEPVPLTIRMQAAEARAERLEKALRNIAAMRWWYGEDLRDATNAARAALAQEDRNG